VIDNDHIINNIAQFKNFGFPVLLGVSRKSFLSINDDSSENRLPASLGVTALAVLNGVDIIRTHDIEETYRMVTVINRVQQSKYHSTGIS
jgi:dihydropteroate synthase